MSYFSQAAYILLKQTPTSDEIDTALSKQGFSSTRHERGTDLLTLATSSTVFEVAFQADKQSSVLIDVMNHRWPDSVSKDDPVLFVSWHAGALGYFAYPGCLERALHECRTWAEVGEAVANHTALLRLHVAYKDRPDRQQEDRVTSRGLAFEELSFITRLLLSFEHFPGVLGYFFLETKRLSAPKRCPKSRDILPKVVIAAHLISGSCG